MTIDVMAQLAIGQQFADAAATAMAALRSVLDMD